MSETVSDAVARVSAPVSLVEASLAEFAKILPKAVDPERFGRWALTCLRNGLNSPKQREAWERVLNPANEAGRLSVMSALMDSASLGLEPGREYHLVPFGSTVTGITDYKGEVKLITNHEPSSVIAMLVHQYDDFHMTGANIPPRHDADWFGNRGAVVGGYAYVDYGSGRYSLVARMRELPDQDDPMADSFQKHREVAKTKAVWDEWPEPMRCKTLVHQLRKMVPWAAERQW
jgi:recombination protein RecT